VKKCNDCKYAEWAVTAKGRLHPSGDGKCKYPYVLPALPRAMYWIGGNVAPCGGHINRRTEFKEHCAYFSRPQT